MMALAEHAEMVRSRFRIGWFLSGELFKYTGPHALRTLESGQIKLTIPSEANDPFEFFPRMQRCAEQLCPPAEEQLDPWINSVVEHYVRVGAVKAERAEWYRTFLRESMNSAFAEHKRTGIPVLDAMNRQFVGGSSNFTAILCLTSQPDDILMWSHYAGNHQGMVLGFDPSRLLALPGVWSLSWVRYSRRRPHVTKEAEPSARRLFNGMLKILTTKSAHWSYEREWRLIVNRKWTKQVKLPNNSEITVLECDRRTFTRVVFGCRCDQKLKTEVLQLLKTPDYHHVAAYQAMPDSYKYSVTLKRIDPTA